MYYYTFNKGIYNLSELILKLIYNHSKILLHIWAIGNIKLKTLLL